MAVFQRNFYAGGAAGGSGGGFRGRWSPDVSYRAGDVVTCDAGVFGATAAVAAGVEPVTDLDVLTGTPADLATADGGDYELVAYFQVREPVRLTGLCFYKSSLQAQVPHVLSLWDRDVSTTTPLLTASVAEESAGHVGVVAAAATADLVPGRRYAASLKSGTGSDTGYARTTGVGLPFSAGPVIVTGLGFSSVVGSIATVTTGSTNFWVWPRVEQAGAGWELLGRRDPVLAGAARTVNRPALPDPLGARPNDGSGFWADFSNTGYTVDPGYAGSVADWTTGMTAGGWVPVQVPDGTVTVGKRFLGKAGIGYGGVGDELVFEGCLFEGTMPNDNLIQVYCPTRVRFVNCTFKPATLATPPGNDGSVSSSATAPGTPYADSWQLLARMVPGRTEFVGCDIWGGAGMTLTGGVDASHQSLFERCYIHDAADNDGSGGSGYHHDGLGPDSEGGSHDTVIRHCTITSLGNTQGVALQGSSTYNRILVEDSLLSGWGYALSLGNTTPWLGSSIRVLNNVWSAELEAGFGPYYGGWRTGHGNLWRGNRFQVRDGDAAAGWTTDDHGGYWWPSDNLPHPADYTN